MSQPPTLEHTQPASAKRGVAFIEEMFPELEKAGCPAKNITRIVLETGSFQDFFEYLKNTRAGKVLLRNALADNSSLSVLVCGADDVTAEEKQQMTDWLLSANPASSPSTTERVQFYNVSTGFDKLQSRNLIKTEDGKFFYWYIPHTEMRDGRWQKDKREVLIPLTADPEKIEADIKAGHTDEAAAVPSGTKPMTPARKLATLFGFPSR